MPDHGSNVGPEKTSAPASAYLARAGTEGSPGAGTPMDPMHRQAAARVLDAGRDPWLDHLYHGDRKVLEGIYQEQFDRIDAAVGTVLTGADRETVVHEV